ncbi:hypothetical protein WAH72_09175 [Acinetobacter baumannii]
MFEFNINSLNKFVLHHVGNKGNGDGLIFSENQEDIYNINSQIVNLFEKSFISEDKFHFYFESVIDLNPVYTFIKKIFENSHDFHNQTMNISRYLYEQSTHPSIQPGELCFAYFENINYKNDKVKGLGIFKSESKETILNIRNNDKGFFLETISGISINKIEKGCFVLDVDMDTGFIVYLVNNLINKNVKYWNDDFLHICPLSDDYSITKSYLNLVRETVLDVCAEDKIQEVDNLSKVLNYFENNDVFNQSEFINCFDNEVIKKTLIENINCTYNSNLEDFNISKVAFKRQKNILKRIIKVNNDFEIIVKGSDILIEKDVDSKGDFYKIYYNRK